MTEKEIQELQSIVIEQIADLCASIGWNIAIPGEEDMVTGLLIGTDDFIEDMLNGTDAEYFINPFNDSGEGSIH